MATAETKYARWTKDYLAELRTGQPTVLLGGWRAQACIRFTYVSLCICLIFKLHSDTVEMMVTFCELFFPLNIE
jgi:hypothetical protein